MIIKPIEKLYGENDTMFTANQKRIKMIKSNISNESNLHKKFVELSENLELGKLDSVLELVTNDLFYEEVESDLIMGLSRAYFGTKPRHREGFIKELEENYKLRGTKSMRYAWSPILKRVQ